MLVVDQQVEHAHFAVAVSVVNEGHNSDRLPLVLDQEGVLVKLSDPYERLRQDQQDHRFIVSHEVLLVGLGADLKSLAPVLVRHRNQSHHAAKVGGRR